MDFFPETFNPKFIEDGFNKKSDEKISEFMAEFKEKYNDNNNTFMISIKEYEFTTYEINEIIKRIKKEPFYTDSHCIRIRSNHNANITAITFKFVYIVIYKNEDAIQEDTNNSLKHMRKYVYDLITKKTSESKHEYTFEVPYKLYTKEVPKFIQELESLGWYVEYTNKWNIIDDDFYVPIIKMRQKYDDSNKEDFDENTKKEMKENFHEMYKSLEKMKEDIDGVVI